MDNPNFAAEEFLDDGIMNALSSEVAGNIASLAAASISPGLLRVDALALSVAGLVVTAMMPAPFAALFGNGILAFANGTTTGVTSSTSTASFASLIPGSGSVTAYLALTLGTVQQGPYQVTGPQPGHPDYNPSFVPYTAYSQIVDTLILSATLTPPDGISSLLLASTVLAAGETNLVLSTLGQNLAQPLPTQQFVNVTTNKSLVPTDAGIMQRLITPGVFLTLPDVSVAERIFAFTSRVASTLQSKSSGQMIFGLGAGPVNSAALLPGQSGAAVSDGLTWQIIASAFAAFTQLLAAPGYIIFPGGLCLQWGNGITVTGNQDAVSYTIPFPNEVFETFANEGNASGWSSSPTVYGTSPVSASSFTVSAMFWGGASWGFAAPVGYRWWALGF